MHARSVHKAGQPAASHSPAAPKLGVQAVALHSMQSALRPPPVQLSQLKPLLPAWSMLTFTYWLHTGAAGQVRAGQGRAGAMQGIKSGQ